MSWELTQWDVNKDIQIGDWAQIIGTKVQVRHACHLFRVYIKSKGSNTVCRVEESVTTKGESAGDGRKRNWPVNSLRSCTIFLVKRNVSLLWNAVLK
jgi:hypothetical protein